MEMPSILLRLNEVENLPTLPIVAQQINKLVAKPNASMAQISALIAKDQAIASRIVRLVNSAFYGFGNRISSIQQAIMLLGLNTVTNLVTGVAIVKMFKDGPASSLFDRERFWLHSFACAIGARNLAKSLRRKEPDDYFLAGLLHNIGVLILDQFFHDEFTKVLQFSSLRRIDYYLAELQVLRTSHSQIGEVVAQKWHIPDFLIHVIKYHHEPLTLDSQAEQSKDIISIVHIADVAANNTGMYMGIFTGRQEYCEQTLSLCGLKNSDIEQVFVTVEKEVKAVAVEWGV